MRRNSYLPFFLLWVASILFFAIVYWLLSFVPGEGSLQLEVIADPIERLFAAIYFSIITGATVGYGDIVPVGAGRGFAALEGIVSFVLLAVFVSKLASRGQETALEHIHTLAFDAQFNSIRHGLFVARKDLDGVIKKVLIEGTGMTDKDAKNVRTAFRQIQIFVRKIPGFYSQKGNAYLDADGEHLLLDSVERSLRRVAEAVHVLQRDGLSCVDDKVCGSELRSIISATDEVFAPHHASRVRSENDELYQEVRLRMDELRSFV